MRTDYIIGGAMVAVMILAIVVFLLRNRFTNLEGDLPSTLLGGIGQLLAGSAARASVNAAVRHSKEEDKK
jgi:hypothetical protein